MTAAELIAGGAHVLADSIDGMTVGKDLEPEQTPENALLDLIPVLQRFGTVPVLRALYLAACEARTHAGELEYGRETKTRLRDVQDYLAAAVEALS